MIGNTNTLPKVFFAATGLLVALAANLLLSDALEAQKYRESQVLAEAAAEETAPLAAASILPTDRPPAVKQPPTAAPTTQRSPSQHQGLGHSPPPAAAILAAPAIGLRVVVFDQGVSEAALRKGPAFFPGRSSPSGRAFPPH